MAAAFGKVADAMQRVGLDRWSRFLADAQNRARDPATESAIKASLNPPDAIKPVYPVEAAIGIAVAGAAGGIAAAARALGGAVLRQVRPDGKPQLPASADVPKPEGNPAPPAENRAENRAEFQGYTDGLRRSMDRPATTDPKLSAIMDEMYRPNAKVGSGNRLGCGLAAELGRFYHAFGLSWAWSLGASTRQPVGKQVFSAGLSGSVTNRHFGA